MRARRERRYDAISDLAGTVVPAARLPQTSLRRWDRLRTQLSLFHPHLPRSLAATRGKSLRAHAYVPRAAGRLAWPGRTLQLTLKITAQGPQANSGLVKSRKQSGQRPEKFWA